MLAAGGRVEAVEAAVIRAEEEPPCGERGGALDAAARRHVPALLPAAPTWPCQRGLLAFVPISIDNETNESTNTEKQLLSVPREVERVHAAVDGAHKARAARFIHRRGPQHEVTRRELPDQPALSAHDHSS